MSKYLYAAVALIFATMLITITTLAITNKGLKAEISTLNLQIDGLNNILAAKTTNLDNINNLLIEAELACQKRITAREEVISQLRLIPPPKVRLPSAPPPSAVAVQKTKKEVKNEDVINFNESTSAIRAINNSLSLQQ